MEKIKLVIAGEVYNISTDNDADYASELGSEVNERIMALVKSNARISVTQAAVLSCLEYADEYKKSEATCENLRTQIQDYLEDAARSRADAEIAKREVDKLNKEIARLKSAAKK